MAINRILTASPDAYDRDLLSTIKNPEEATLVRCAALDAYANAYRERAMPLLVEISENKNAEERLRAIALQWRISLEETPAEAREEDQRGRGTTGNKRDSATPETVRTRGAVRVRGSVAGKKAANDWRQSARESGLPDMQWLASLEA